MLARLFAPCGDQTDRRPYSGTQSPPSTPTAARLLKRAEHVFLTTLASGRKRALPSTVAGITARGVNVDLGNLRFAARVLLTGRVVRL
jgi:hypothetical protein